MNANEAKDRVADALDAAGIRYVRLTARKVGFQDLARDDAYNVTVQMALPEPRLRQVRERLRGDKILIEAEEPRP